MAVSEQVTAAPAKPKFGLSGALRPARPALALVCALIAFWIAWRLLRPNASERGEAALVPTREAAAKSVAELVKHDIAELAKRVATEPVQAALAAKDLKSAGQALGHGCVGVEQAQVLEPALV